MNNYNIKLTQGQEVEIYLLPKNDEKYEGKAILISKLQDGVTFFEDEEQLCPDNIQLLVYSNLSKKLTKNEKRNIKIYNYLESLRKSKNNVVVSFFKEMNKSCTKNINSPNKMLQVINSYKEQYKDTVGVINSLLDIDYKILIKYFQQTKMKSWRPTLYKLEKWKVEIIPKDKFEKSYITVRWIKVLVSICPSDDHRFSDSLSRLTTY